MNLPTKSGRARLLPSAPMSPQSEVSHDPSPLLGGGVWGGVWPGRNHKYVLVGNLLLWPLDFLSFTYGCPVSVSSSVGLPMGTI